MDLAMQDNQPTQEDYQVLENKLSQLELKFSDLNRLFRERPDRVKLTIPLDSFSREAILQEILLPVPVRLKSTEPATSANYGVFFVSNDIYDVYDAVEVHGTAGSDGSDVTLNIEKLTSTQAPGSGTTLLSTEFNLKGTANTPQYAEFKTTPQDIRILGRGERLALKLTGTPTAVANLVVTVYLRKR
jgi:hypothetical protein